MPNNRSVARILALGLLFQSYGMPVLAAEAPAPDKHQDKIAYFIDKTKANPDFVVRFTTGIYKEHVDKLIEKLKELAAKDPKARITLWLDSGGGHVAEGWRMAKAIRETPNPVDFVCAGDAASMAAIVYIDHPKIKGVRYAFDDCKFMTHAAFWHHADGKREGYTKKSELVADRHIFARIIERVARTSYTEALKFVREGDKHITLAHAKRVNFFDELISYHPKP